MLQKMKLEDFDKVYEIMEEAFPFDEIRPYNEQKQLLNNKKFSIYVLPDKEENLIKAFVSVYNFNKFVYIEHFATNSKFRNQGLGAKILDEIFKMYKCRICLEAEPPENELSIRRIEFYKRNGFFKNDYDYIQPAMSKGRKPVPLVVLTSNGEVNRQEFEEIKQTLYKEVYKVNDNLESII